MVNLTELPNLFFAGPRKLILFPGQFGQRAQVPKLLQAFARASVHPTLSVSCHLSSQHTPLLSAAWMLLGGRLARAQENTDHAK